MSHTKGPWKWEEQNGSTMPMLWGLGDNLVCSFGDCETYYPTEGTPPEDADRLLIAAAPDLLEAAEEVLKYVDPANDAGKQPLRQLADAVRRAKGV